MQQAELAARQWLNALQIGGIFLPVVVLVETVWVLARTAKLDRERIVAGLWRLSLMEGVCVKNASVVKQAIELYANSAADFADCLVPGSARQNDALPVYTFNRRVHLQPALCPSSRRLTHRAEITLRSQDYASTTLWVNIQSPLLLDTLIPAFSRRMKEILVGL